MIDFRDLRGRAVNSLIALTFTPDRQIWQNEPNYVSEDTEFHRHNRPRPPEPRGGVLMV